MLTWVEHRPGTRYLLTLVLLDIMLSSPAAGLAEIYRNDTMIISVNAPIFHFASNAVDVKGALVLVEDAAGACDLSLVDDAIDAIVVFNPSPGCMWETLAAQCFRIRCRGLVYVEPRDNGGLLTQTRTSMLSKPFLRHIPVLAIGQGSWNLLKKLLTTGQDTQPAAELPVARVGDAGTLMRLQGSVEDDTENVYRQASVAPGNLAISYLLLAWQFVNGCMACVAIWRTTGSPGNAEIITFIAGTQLVASVLRAIFSASLGVFSIGSVVQFQGFVRSTFIIPVILTAAAAYAVARCYQWLDTVAGTNPQSFWHTCSEQCCGFVAVLLLLELGVSVSDTHYLAQPTGYLILGSTTYILAIIAVIVKLGYWSTRLCCREVGMPGVTTAVDDAGISSSSGLSIQSLKETAFSSGEVTATAIGLGISLAAIAMLVLIDHSANLHHVQTYVNVLCVGGSISSSCLLLSVSKPLSDHPRHLMFASTAANASPFGHEHWAAPTRSSPFASSNMSPHGHGLHRHGHGRSSGSFSRTSWSSASAHPSADASMSSYGGARRMSHPPGMGHRHYRRSSASDGVRSLPRLVTVATSSRAVCVPSKIHDMMDMSLQPP